MATVYTASESRLNTARKWPVVCAGLLAIGLLFGLDALLFRTKMYPQLLEPGSSTGLFELILAKELRAQKRLGDNLVATLGNSRFGWSPMVVDHERAGAPYLFRDAGLAGSDPRVWYFMVRELDPTARRYRALVFGLDTYEDEDRAFNPADDIRDLHYVINRLHVADIFDFAHSFDAWPLRWSALRGGFFRGLVYQEDIRAFLTHPRKRLRDVRLARNGYESWVYTYKESERTMAGLKIDWRTLAVTFPPGADEDQRSTVMSFLAHGEEPQTGRLTQFRRLWLGRIVEHYRGSPTKIIFLRLPRGPIPRPDSLRVRTDSTIRDLARTHPNVLLAGEHAFDSLEHPELFKDGMHLNREGINRFSVMMVDEVVKLLSN